MSGARRLVVGTELVLASHNRGKLAEFETLLAGSGVRVLGAASLALPEPDETADTFAGNAAIKALAAATATGKPALSDDSGFCVAALDGAPGVYSARWGGPGRDFAMAMERVHTEMDVAADRSAWFSCVLCLAWPDGHVDTFEGRVDGQVVWPPRGEHGHGYDPIFVPAGDHRTFAEMDGTAKNAVSHRGRALALFRAACLPQ
ncbi:deoxyribonucleotide triphosphate pyrophosphatase [Ameyamaea chiangmaiensis NBRC 103196]|uniref:dITP/XTP pyrophosphatase n=1 Tax=Ameyamaea chiangmaiensis TaxID=442969 RepID=A0A850P950_9PROT|nr:RdgB/HAM1 family non-canonical purine NTP pyrophosphatase [Ameyamaea chiangmaiensis]MBS4073946.1 RdgB/HAM1 family non-canonical purine NTP pyrophosphatase [Ameyamaea chiangmaiensis]NVN41107.1 RdgB/HAM1 family non-canonical purine NTP pyrophosphatase [Ameyamaea chiangmaiensis]GBQ67827.1 deoxyribonucleotide triphosphate pyrophosphatase [Ameyamaea chiangmaiensis NBRC 103196]